MTCSISMFYFSKKNDRITNGYNLPSGVSPRGMRHSKQFYTGCSFPRSNHLTFNSIWYYYIHWRKYHFRIRDKRYSVTIHTATRTATSNILHYIDIWRWSHPLVRPPESKSFPCRQTYSSYHIKLIHPYYMSEFPDFEFTGCKTSP